MLTSITSRTHLLACLLALLVLSLSSGTTCVLAQQPAQQPAIQKPFVPQGFQLNTIEQTFLNQVLDQWEEQSSKVNTFHCQFTRLVYDPVFGPGKDPGTGIDRHKLEEQGELSYQKPDKGSFHIKSTKAWDAAKAIHIANSAIIGEHWVCNGKAVFEYKTETKQLVERTLPPELQGTNIVDGPLPFLFGAEAAKLKERYWLRIDPRSAKNQIRLVAMPKRKSDAANYRYVELMLDKQRMMPIAMQVHHPDESRAVYTFDLDGAQVNGRMAQLWNQLFQSPRTPFGWTRVVDPQATQQLAQPAAAAGSNTRR